MLKTRLIFAAIFSICKTSIALPIQREFPLLESAANYAQLCEQCNSLSLKPCIDFDLTDAEWPHFNMSLYCREWKQLVPSCNIAVLKRTKSDGESLCLLSESDYERVRRSASNEEVEGTTASAVEEHSKPEDVANSNEQELMAEKEPETGAAATEEQPNVKVRQAPEDEGEAENEGAAEVTEVKETDNEAPADADAEAPETEKQPEAEEPAQAETDAEAAPEAEEPEAAAEGVEEAAEPPPPAAEEAPIESPATADAEESAESQPTAEDAEQAAEKPPAAVATEVDETPAEAADDGTQNEVSAAEAPAVVDYQADEASPPIEGAVPAEGEAKANEVPATNDVAGVMAKAFACYTCTGGIDDIICRTKPTKTVNCPKGAETMERKGCFTLLKADTNTTERGCLDDLTAEGQQFCRKQMKLCHLCYENGCNQMPAPSTANTNNIGVAWQLTLLLAVGNALMINRI